MIRNIISYILRAPYHLLMLFSLAASIYAAYNHIQGISWGASIILGVIILAYWMGLAFREND